MPVLKTENRNKTNQKKGHAHYANYEQIDSWTHCSGFRHHLFVAVVDVDTDSRLHRRNKCSVAMIDSVLSEPEATAIGAACFGSGLLRLHLVQQERHAQVLGWFLCGHDDGSGPCHGSNDYCRLAAAAPFSDESGGEVTLSTPNQLASANRRRPFARHSLLCGFVGAWFEGL